MRDVLIVVSCPDVFDLQSWILICQPATITGDEPEITRLPGEIILSEEQFCGIICSTVVAVHRLKLVH